MINVIDFPRLTTTMVVVFVISKIVFFFDFVSISQFIRMILWNSLVAKELKTINSLSTLSLIIFVL